MKYYKITSEDEKHYNMQYQDGLNIDVLPFRPFGSCESGGIYFAREDILAFLDFGPWIRQVTLPPNEAIYENPDTPQKWKARRVILGPRRRIDAGIVQELLDEGADPKANDSVALRWSAENGHTEIVQMLLPISDPQTYDSEALRLAAENGHTDIVRLLLPVSNPHAFSFEALRWAAENGHTEIVRMLLPVSDPKTCNSAALRGAARNGHTEIVRMLLPVSDAKTFSSEALRWAAENGHTEIVKILLPLSDFTSLVRKHTILPPLY